MCFRHIESDYYMWLLDRVDVLHGGHMNYLLLMQHLFKTKYEYALEMDGNRAWGGKNLRKLFAEESGFYLEDVYQGPCTVLEMLEALAESIAFDTDMDISRWFWEMLHNLELDQCDDETYDRYYVDARLRLWLDRRYDAEGKGGLFPVKGFSGDMRRMETWDQKNVYMSTKYPVGNWLS